MMKKIARFRSRWCQLALIAIPLAGCGSVSTPLTDVVSALAARGLGSAEDTIQTSKLNPLYRYLKVNVEGGPSALLVLGYIDPHPQGDIEVWYSAEKEVIKLQHGRIVGTAGLAIDWRAVHFPSAPPDWTAVPSQGSVYQRLRDEMPAYRYGISEQIELKPWLGVPAITLPASLPDAQARAYGWFRETTRTSGDHALPPAWFAWGRQGGQSTVLYSEQCLSATVCLTLQRWPIQEDAL